MLLRMLDGNRAYLGSFLSRIVDPADQEQNHSDNQQDKPDFESVHLRLPFPSIKRRGLGGAQPDERPRATRVHSSEGDVDDLDNRPAALVSTYNRANVRPPLGEYFVSALSNP